MKRSIPLTRAIKGLVVIATVFATTQAMAQEGDRTPPLAPTHAPPPHVEEALRDADANKDGFISKEELQAFQDRVVKEADANKDGKISAEEWRNHHRAKMQQRDCVKP